MPNLPTKEAAIQAFFEGFGIPAYPVTSVPDPAKFPWMTYELATGAWLEGELTITVNIWYYTDSEAIPNAKAREISRAIGLGGVTIPCADGFVWLKRGTPWCQSLRDETDPMIKRRYINITAEYCTSY